MIKRSVFKKTLLALGLMTIPALSSATVVFEAQLDDELSDTLYFGSAAYLDTSCKILSLNSDKVAASCDVSFGTGKIAIPILNSSTNKQVSQLLVSDPLIGSATISLRDPNNYDFVSYCDTSGQCTNDPITRYYLLANPIDGTPNYPGQKATIIVKRV